MIRIRKIFNPRLESNQRQMEKVREIIRVQFPDISEQNIDAIGNHMADPVGYKYQSILFIAEDIHEVVRGFALMLYMSDLHFCYLDYIAVSPEAGSSGLGGALYERIRDEAGSLGVTGLFFECLPDDPGLCQEEEKLIQNRKRLAFYERFGARPISNTLYETPVHPGEKCPPYLVFDGLGKADSIPRDLARQIVKAILDRKYGDYCPVSYIEAVVESIRDEPVTLRLPRYLRPRSRASLAREPNDPGKIFLIVNDRHNIHHIRERGYVESPVRVENIRKELDKTDLFRYGTARPYPEQFITEVHDPGYFSYFKRVCKDLPPGKSVYPYVFPLRNAARAPKELSVRAGYYCFDTFTPLNQNAYLAARWGVNCTLTAADEIIAGTRAAYVLTRPPGHHAERSVFGGFCYFNNNAIAANYLGKLGRVAILDIDFHHGNGQQQIFYRRSDVLTVSIHGHPSFAYPYFSGFTDENGEGSGSGFNLNFPLPETITFETYETVLLQALKRIEKFRPDFLVVALGLDTAKGDPTGTWTFVSANFRSVGAAIGNLGLPTLIVQEGGYKNQSIGTNAQAFFTGLHACLNANRKPEPI